MQIPELKTISIFFGKNAILSFRIWFRIQNREMPDPYVFNEYGSATLL